MHKSRKCPGCRRPMKLTAGQPISEKTKAAVYYCPFCIELSRKVMAKIEELDKAIETVKGELNGQT